MNVNELTNARALSRAYRNGAAGGQEAALGAAKALALDGSDKLNQPGPPATPTGRSTRQMDEAELQEQLAKTEKKLLSLGVELKFKLHKDSGEMQVEVVEPDSGKVVRKLPPDELLKLSANMEEALGAFLDRSY